MLHQLPPDLSAIDRDSRERFSVAAAFGFIWQCPPELIHEIVAGGKDAFRHYARRGFETQEFRQEDLDRIFMYLEDYDRKMWPRNRPQPGLITSPHGR